MRTTARLLAVASGLLLATPRATIAQHEPESIPRVLVESALGLFGGTEMSPHFTVGRAPTGWPAALVPAKPATLIGGSSTGPMLGIVVQLPRRGAPFDALSPMLERAGYHKADSARTAGEGFAGRRLPGEFAPGELWCGAPSVVMLMRVLDSSTTSRRIALTRLTEMSGSTCSPRSADLDDRQFGPHVALRVPVLAAPVGAMVVPVGSNSSDASFDTRAYADDALTATALAEHYSGELGRAGWTLLGGTVGTDRTAVRSLRATDPNGATWEGALVIVTAGSRRWMNIYMSATGAQ